MCISNGLGHVRPLLPILALRASRGPATIFTYLQAWETIAAGTRTCISSWYPRCTERPN